MNATTNLLKAKWLLLLLVVSQHYLYTQPSFSTSIAFRLLDENDRLVNKDQFLKEYKIANVNGDFIDAQSWEHYLYYNPQNHSLSNLAIWMALFQSSL